MPTLTFDEALSSIEKLPLEQQETLIETIHKRLIEARRKEIAKNARETLGAYRAGKVKRGTARDLRKSMVK